jgi:FKBP-type peptidyl-prolyl cis-trans isomerase FklB
MRYHISSRLLSALVVAGVLTLPSFGFAASAPAVTTTTVTTAAPAAKIAAPTSSTDKLSYTIGVDMGNSLKAQQLDINPGMLAQGITDAISGSPLLLTKQQMDKTLQDYQKTFLAKQQQAFAAQADQNAKTSADFLAKNKTQPGVQTLSDGLQYKIIKPGSGNSPVASDKVTVNYEGTLVDGTVFDSTYKRGKPASFGVSQVIPGWQEALKMMKPGAEWMIYIPPQLAYGKQGVGGPIGPNEALIFKVELISVDGTAS